LADCGKGKGNGGEVWGDEVERTTRIDDRDPIILIFLDWYSNKNNE